MAYDPPYSYHPEWQRLPEVVLGSEEPGTDLKPIPYGVSPLPRAETISSEQWTLKLLRTAVGSTILGLFVWVAQWYNTGLTLTERARNIRDDNEGRALKWVAEPKAFQHTTPGVPIVYPPDLARTYHDSKRSADYAYTGQTVTIPCRQYVVRGREVHWHLGDRNVPAAVVMELAEGSGVPAAAQNHLVLWVTGYCEGRVDDGVQRELPGHQFYVRVSGCRATLE